MALPPLDRLSAFRAQRRAVAAKAHESRLGNQLAQRASKRKEATQDAQGNPTRRRFALSPHTTNQAWLAKLADGCDLDAEDEAIAASFVKDFTQKLGPFYTRTLANALEMPHAFETCRALHSAIQAERQAVEEQTQAAAEAARTPEPVEPRTPEKPAPKRPRRIEISNDGELLELR